MFLLASEEAAHYVLRNVDRPFDATLEKPVVYIQPDDNTIAHIAVYCTLKDAGQVVRRLFFVVLENTKSPESATKKEDFSCLLVNSDGKVLSRDNDYWNALPLDAQQKAGAIDTNGPPFIATSLLKLR